jgi:hypothetical protein
MIAAQLYFLVPPMLAGRKELPLAEKLNDSFCTPMSPETRPIY